MAASEAVAPGYRAYPRTSERQRAKTGFTLIEVLATLVVVAIVLPVAMKGISLSLGAAGHARNSVEAAQLAETKLNEMVATGQWQAGSASGDFGQDWPGCHWTVTTAERDTNLMQLDVKVTWPWRNTERSVTVSTLVYTADTTGDTQQ